MKGLLIVVSLFAIPAIASAAIRVNPDGVNVNSQAATTVFLTFGGLNDQVPAEAVWCGELIPASPDIGFKCNPATFFGSLPVRFNRSTPSGVTGFTDIMSIPPSVARRAYQAAAAGQTSSFFYVRRFVSTVGGRDEYVVVTCRMAGGGARVPLALLDVQLKFMPDVPVLFVHPREQPSGLAAEIAYNGTGRLKGRWEVVLPGDELPTAEDLLTEATLPPERRGLQRQYTQLERFNIFLPPTGRITLKGPDPSRLPVDVEGTYLVLLRVEASDDKEGDSNLATAGAGAGIVHSGAVAGFPLPALRYVVSGTATSSRDPIGTFRLLLPAEGAELNPAMPMDLSWEEHPAAVLYRVEVENSVGAQVLSAFVQPGTSTYRLPPWITDTLTRPGFRWRLVALDADARTIRATSWRSGRLGS